MTLQEHITKINTHTLNLDGPDGTESLNLMYAVPSTTRMMDHIYSFSANLPNSVEAINNVYELPSIETEIRYLHGAAGFPTKATWIKTIRNSN